MDKLLIKQYKDVLNDANKTENDVQDFLEDNTQLIPLPILENHGLSMNAVISKFRLGNEAITDFSYLTKSSNLWRFVLIELENPHKKVFKKSNDKVEFTADFNRGLDQIRSWRVYINGNREQVLRQIKMLLRPIQMANNPVYFEFVLVIGRDDEEFGNTEFTMKKRQHLANLMDSEGIKVLSYDTLYRRYINFYGADREKVVLSPWREQGYSIKSLPKGEIDTTLFSFLSPENLKVSAEQEKKLTREGYEMDEWRNGFSLYINNKQAMNILLKEKCRFDGTVVNVQG